MKTRNLITLALIVFSSITSSLAQQDSSGVYLSASDFKNGKLAYAINCKTQKHKIKLNEFFSKPYITIVHEGKSVNLDKKNIFGFRDCGDVAYRFVDQNQYTILNPTEEILLYRHVAQSASKNQPETVYYFFSKSAQGEVLDLNLTSLKKAFPDNHRFHDLLDAQFNSSTPLTAYDSHHKMYKVNRLYQNSLQ